MAKIIYFGANGKAGHLPIGIDKDLTNEEFGTWCGESLAHGSYDLQGIGRTSRSIQGANTIHNGK